MKRAVRVGRDESEVSVKPPAGAITLTRGFRQQDDAWRILYESLRYGKRTEELTSGIQRWRLFCHNWRCIFTVWP
jgi:hypothetical protein